MLGNNHGKGPDFCLKCVFGYSTGLSKKLDFNISFRGNILSIDNLSLVKVKPIWLPLYFISLTATIIFRDWGQ